MRFLKTIRKADYTSDFLLSLLFIIIYFECTKEWKYAKSEDLANLKAYTPFQYRVLIPYLAFLIKSVIPNQSFFFIYQIILLPIVFISSRMLRIYLMQFDFNSNSINLSILIFFYILFWNYPALGIWFYPYDLPAILFFLTGLYFIKKEKFIYFYPFFILGTLNRETIIIILLAYVLSFRSFGNVFKISNIGIISLFIATWLIIKYYLYIEFSSNPAEQMGGNLFLNKTSENIQFLLGLLKLDKFYILRIFSFGGLWLFIYKIKDELDDFSKRMLIIVPIFLLIIFFVGKLQEVRIYSELVPLFIIPGRQLLRKYLLTN